MTPPLEKRTSPLEGLPEEMRFVVTAARRRLEPADAERLRSLLGGPLSWPRVLATADRHRVSILLFKNLEALDDPRVPETVLDHLRGLSRTLHRSNLVLSAELLRCLDGLAGAGVEAIPYKGPALAALAYGDPGARVFGDLDVVVRRADAPGAFAALNAMGYRIDHPIAAGRAERFFRFHCQHGFQGASGIRVEVHWAFLPAYYSFDLDPASLWGRLATVNLLGREVPHFGIEDLVLVLSAHGYKHYWARLEWISAVAEILRAHPALDGEALLGRARAVGGERILGLGLGLAAELLGAPVPAPCRAATQDAAVARCIREARAILLTDEIPHPGFWRRTRLRLMARERLRDRLRYGYRLAAGMEPMSMWSQEPAWGPLDRALRPVRFLQLLGERERRGLGW